MPSEAIAVERDAIASVADRRAREDEVVDLLREQRDSRSFIPALKIDFDEERGVSTISFDHEDEAIASALAMYHVGTADIEFFTGLLKQISSLAEPDKHSSVDAANFALSTIRCIEPQDEIEAMLAAQMAATHQLTMQTARRMALAGTLAGKDSAERAFNKLTRTYTAQMDALKKHRAKAQQIVRVERVTVTDGGQAVVGDVSYQRGASEKS